MTDISKATNSSQKSRVDWVDYAKGFCIILVVMMHSTLGVEKAAGETGWLGTFVEFARPFRMPDFFMISGLFLGLVISRPWLRYFDRKVVHFFYFYVLWVTIQFAFKAPVWLGEGATISDLVSKYASVFVAPFGTLWFIYMLPIFFVVTRLLKALPWQLIVGAAALLQIAPIHTGILLIDEFASRYVFFLAGYLFAANIFTIAEWVRNNTTIALGLLIAWALANGTIVFAPIPEFISNMVEVKSLADLPVVSLALGAMGALAIIAVSTLLSTLRWTKALEYLGKNSIVVYLAFFLPMAISRIILLKFAPFLDVGTVSAIVTASAVIGPVIFYLMIQWTGWGKFLFERPNWAKLENDSPEKATLHTEENGRTPGLLNPAE